VIQNRKTSIAKACCAVNAVNRWALSGTPIQNRLTNLASIFEFLKVYPFSDPTIFDVEITKPWLCGDQQGVLRLKSLVNYTTLCRTTGVINLPERVDQIHHLEFSAAEQEVYDAAKIRTAGMLDDAILGGSSQRGLYLNALQWLNTLRLICNHGVLESRRTQTQLARADGLPDEPWNEVTAQAAFQNIVCAGAAICSNCTANLLANYEESSKELSESTRPRLLACLQLLCDTCFREKSEDIRCPACSSVPRCAAFGVSLAGDTTTPSQMTTPSGNINDVDVPVKLKALVKDLESTRDAKR
jgi:SWI/SNF-related matrix-associated actin-dependent regulator of chromatin subfamily A3